ELGKRAEHATAGGNALDLAAGAQDERRRVAGTRDDQAGTVAVPPETDVRGGAEPPVAVTAHDFVHEIEDEARTWRLDDGGARRVANERGERGRLRTLPADVPDHDRPVVAGALEDVVEVASDVAPGPRRFVVRRDLDAGDGGKVRRKQALLERFGQLRQAGAAGSQLTFGLGPFDELADLRAGGVHHRQDVVRGLPALGGEEFDRAEHVAAAPDRNAEASVQPVGGGDFRPREVGIVADVRDPRRLPGGPNPPGQAFAAAEGQRGGELLERGGVAVRRAPGREAAQHRTFDVEAP